MKPGTPEHLSSILLLHLATVQVKGDSASLIMNVSGKLVLIQRERSSTEEMLYSAPTVLAGSCEQVLGTTQATHDSLSRCGFPPPPTPLSRT